MTDVKLPTEKMVVFRGALKGDWYTAAQMLAIHEQGRLAGLEAAGKAVRNCNSTLSMHVTSRECNAHNEAVRECSDAIRALAASDGGKG